MRSLSVFLSRVTSNLWRMWFDVIVKIGSLCEMKISFLVFVKIVAGLGVNSQPWKWNLKGSKNVIIVVCEEFCPGENFLFVVQAVRLNRFLDLWLNCLVSRYRESEVGCYVFFVIIVSLWLLFFLNWCSFCNRGHKIVKKDTKKVKGLGRWWISSMS